MRGSHTLTVRIRYISYMCIHRRTDHTHSDVPLLCGCLWKMPKFTVWTVVVRGLRSEDLEVWLDSRQTTTPRVLHINGASLSESRAFASDLHSLAPHSTDHSVTRLESRQSAGEPSEALRRSVFSTWVPAPGRLAPRRLLVRSGDKAASADLTMYAALPTLPSYPIP